MNASILFRLVALTLLLGVLAVDDRALWTDEIGTWALTQPPTWAAWWDAFLRHTNSDGQLPLYHAYMRLWVLLVGDAEWQLRAANLPWLLLAFVGLSRLRLQACPQPWLLAVMAGHAFVWYYLNDARPYVMYVAGACWLAVGMFRLCTPGIDDAEIDTGLRECLLGSLVLLGGSILGAFWIVSSVVVLVVLYPAVLRALLRSMGRQALLTVAVVAACMAIVGVALHSHLSGARASQAADFSVAGMAYGFIELLGAAGIGPSRNELRQSLGNAPKGPLITMLVLAVFTTGAVVWSWWRLPSRRSRLALLLGVGLPLLIMVLLGVLLHWRVVGRHLSAMLPVVIIGLAAFLHQTLGQRGHPFMRCLAAVIALGLLVSAGLVRFDDRHAKDDYRLAATWARDALNRGATVLWLADARGLRYYGLSEDRRAAQITVPAGLIPYEQFPAIRDRIPVPDVIVFSPREGVDPTGVARPVLTAGAYELKGRAVSFELYFKREIGGADESRP